MAQNWELERKLEVVQNKLKEMERKKQLYKARYENLKNKYKNLKKDSLAYAAELIEEDNVEELLPSKINKK